MGLRAEQISYKDQQNLPLPDESKQSKQTRAYKILGLGVNTLNNFKYSQSERWLLLADQLTTFIHNAVADQCSSILLWVWGALKIVNHIWWCSFPPSPILIIVSNNFQYLFATKKSIPLIHLIWISISTLPETQSGMKIKSSCLIWISISTLQLCGVEWKIK